MFCILVLVLFLGLVFFTFSKFNFHSKEASSSFECGFNSSFESRFSFSIHYYIVGLIFLLLDMELCLLLPFFLSSSHSKISLIFMFIFVSTLLTGLILEWKNQKLDWSY